MRALFLDVLDVYLLFLNTRRGRVGKGRSWPLFTVDGLGEGDEYVFHSAMAVGRRSQIKVQSAYFLTGYCEINNPAI